MTLIKGLNMHNPEGYASLIGTAKPNYVEVKGFSYVRLLRRISSHYRIGLGREMRNALCSKCNSVLVPGLTANVVLASSKGYAVYTCKRCGAERHIIYKATKGKTRKRG